MYKTIEALQSEGIARSPLSRHSFLLLLCILLVSLASVDVWMYGPLTAYTADLLVVRPVEREWGFHAERKDYESPGERYSLLTIIHVTSGGAFERAGIRAGFAFAPPTSGTGGPWFGGAYSLFAGRNSSRVRMLPDPSNRGIVQVYEVLR